MEHIEMNHSMEKAMLQHAFAAQSPINGTLELLPLCNMNCDMCYIRLDRVQVKAGGGLHTADEWISLGQEMAKAGVLFLLLTGGEPLLFPDFRKLYTELKKMGIILTLNSNGTMLDEDWADFFAAHKPRRINITLYGATDDAYEKLCHYPGGFSKTIQAIRLLRERNVDVKINGSVTKDNRDDMEAIYQIGRELDVPVHMDTYMLPGIHERNLPFEQQARLLPEDAAAAEIVMRKVEMEQEAFWQYAQEISVQTGQKAVYYPDQITCLAGNCSFAISWQGQMRPCVTFENPAVSVFERGFSAAWTEISQTAKTLKISQTCVRCPLRPACKICAASAKLETGSCDGVPEYLCRYTKELVRLLKEEWKQKKEADSNG